MNELSREQWLEQRRHHIGASEVAAIIGVSPFADALSVWDSKVNGQKEQADAADYLEFGRDMEEPIAKLYAKRSGRQVDNLGETTLQMHPYFPWLGATLDRRIEGCEKTPAPDNGPGALEIKNVGAPRFAPAEWTADNPEVLHHVIQNQIQMACTGWMWGCVAGMFPRYQLPWFDLKRDDDLLNSIYPVPR